MSSNPSKGTPPSSSNKPSQGSSTRTSQKDLRRNMNRSPGTSVSDQRTNFRKEFLRRLRTGRNDQVDRLRCICEQDDIPVFNSVSDLRRVLENDELAQDLLNSEDLTVFLQQVETEILAEQGVEQYERFTAAETDATVANLMTKCTGCNAPIYEGHLCSKCADELTSD